LFRLTQNAKRFNKIGRDQRSPALDPLALVSGKHKASGNRADETERRD
jgi:hypothetical protein